MSVWDGFGPPHRDEDDDQTDGWEDSDDGDLPWDPNPVEKPQPWEAPKWGGTPEEQMYRDLLADEDDEED